MSIAAKTIVAQARSWLGTKYHHQGRLKRDDSDNLGGVDCVGLVMGIAKELALRSADNDRLLAEFDETGYSMHPDGVSLQSFLDKHLRCVKVSAHETVVSKIRPGDVLLFKLFEYPQHVGIATNCASSSIGFIHCYSGSGQVVEHLLSPAWQRMLVAAYRFKQTKY